MCVIHKGLKVLNHLRYTSTNIFLDGDKQITFANTKPAFEGEFRKQSHKKDQHRFTLQPEICVVKGRKNLIVAHQQDQSIT